MEIKILDSIIHGVLKPWKVDTTNNRKFTELIKAAKATAPKTNAELIAYLVVLLADFPTLQKVLKDETLNDKTPLEQHFFKIDLPKYKDPITQFYFSIITAESLRVFNTFLQQSATWTEPVDLRYQVGKTLTNIRVLAQQTAIELKERVYTCIPDSQSDHIHYSLYTLKQMLTALFFEVQEQFATQLTESISEDFFYLHYLQETYPDKPPLTPNAPYFEFHFRSIQTFEEYSKSAALYLLSQIQQHQPSESQKLQAAFENLIFLHLYNTDLGLQTLDQLTDHIAIKKLLEIAKETLFIPVIKLQFGHQRLEAVNNLLDELDYIPLPVNNKLSIPQMLYKYLQEQREIYTQRFIEKFPIILNDQGSAQQQDNKPQKLSFGFHGDSAKLKTVVIQLCNQVELLNEEKNNSEELIAILTSKDIQPDSSQIYIGCETVQFRYIIDKFNPHFTNLNPKALESSGAFFTKRNKPLKAQNLYSNKIENPKNQLIIDNIFKQLQ